MLTMLRAPLEQAGSAGGSGVDQFSVDYLQITLNITTQKLSDYRCLHSAK